jgi:hypothetical protein
MKIFTGEGEFTAIHHDVLENIRMFAAAWQPVLW